MFKRVPGTKDIFGDEVILWQDLESTARGVFSLYNYKEIRVPVMEEAALFNRSLGEETEVVQKQMFVIQRGEDAYALRPEGTAPVVRAYLENNLDKTQGFVKLFYIGPMFRAERPQKGRQRQFHHIGCEALGSTDFKLDAEVISLADRLLKDIAVTDYTIQLNTLGCVADKLKFQESLLERLKGSLDDLCLECRQRYQRNPLRILDCKNEQCKEIVRQQLDHGDKFLCNECKAHFEGVKSVLDETGTSYKKAPYLVRGLDYYTRTVFEITHQGLGSQDALGAGGRYDTLIRQLGGADSGAIGFALGVERVLLALTQKQIKASQLTAYIVMLGENAKKAGMKLLSSLRLAGISCDTDYENKSLKGALRIADDLGAKCVIIIGDNELSKNVILLKDMIRKEQREISQDSLIEEIRKI